MEFNTVVLPPISGPGYGLNIWCDTANDEALLQSLASADAWLWFYENTEVLPPTEEEGYEMLLSSYRARLKNMACPIYRQKALTRVTESLEEWRLLVPFAQLLKKKFNDTNTLDEAE